MITLTKRFYFKQITFFRALVNIKEKNVCNKLHMWVMYSLHKCVNFAISSTKLCVIFPSKPFNLYARIFI